MLFEMTHVIFGNKEIFDEESIPSWIMQDDAWYWDNFIRKLDLGEEIESEFSMIKRIK